MSTDSGRELEMQRIQAGHYVIGDYEVERGVGRKWVITLLGMPVGIVGSLEDVKDLIRKL
jgi:hypothetical protein